MDFESVLAILQEESNLRKKRTRTIRTGLSVIFLISICLVLWTISRGKSDASDLVLMISPFLCLAGISAGFSPKAKSMLLSSTTETDPRLVGFLCEALASGDQGLVESARNHLLVLFPKLTDNAGALSFDQHMALATSLQTSVDPFTSAALTALGLIGRRESIPILESYATGRAWISGKPVSAAAKNAAEFALPKLRIRIAKEIIGHAVSEAESSRARYAPVAELHETA